MEAPRLVFWSWLNALRWKHYKDPAWIAARTALWRRTALAAIQRQTVTDWTYLVLCASGTEADVHSAVGTLNDPRVRIVFGDDKAPHQARAALPEGDRHLLMRCDSDDRLHPRAGSILLANAERGRPWLQFNNGWAVQDKTIYRWNSRSSPFYARVFTRLRDGAKWEQPDHTTIAGKALILDSGYFCVTLHKHNTSSTTRHAGTRCDPALAERVREQFAIDV